MYRTVVQQGNVLSLYTLAIIKIQQTSSKLEPQLQLDGMVRYFWHILVTFSDTTFVYHCTEENQRGCEC